MNSLSQLRLDLLSEIAQVETSPQLASMKARALGKEGVLSERMRSLSTLPMSERTEAGRGLNLLKRELETALREKEAQLRKAQLNERLSQEAVDVTLPGRGLRPGGLHVITVVGERISAILRSMGFDMADGPEIEEDFFNFTALNTPSNHPARSMHDTFYVDVPGREGLLLRTHTSPVQVRYARRHSPPIRVFTIGKTFRVDSDATHSPMFHQVEGLWVGDDVNFCNLKCLYSDFLRAFFERNDLEIRFRPSYFPFTEPSAEIDIRFPDGPLAGCWLEISGAGQVHPNVVRNFNLDPQEHIGFAFGSGVERLAMLLHGIDDVRLFYNNDLRFLRQFVS